MSTRVARVFPSRVRTAGTCALIITAFLSFAASGSHAQSLFQPQVQLNGGIRPVSIAIGDLNGDGYADLAVGNDGPTLTIGPGYFADSAYVSILLGTGGGSFAPRNGFALGFSQEPQRMVISDLNDDGRPDLVLAVHDLQFGGSGVEILMGNGDGTFPPRTFLNAGSGVSSLAVGDLNGDGHPDLVTTNQPSNTVSVLLGYGDGTFGAVMPYPTGNQPVSVAIADFNVDGFPDVVTSNYIGGSISMLLGNGDGTLAYNADVATLSAPLDLAVGDLNRDGLPDVAVTHQNDIDVSVHYNLGDGVLGPNNDYPSGSLPRALAIGELDFKAYPDLVVAKGSGSTAVLLATAEGSFAPEEDFSPGGFAVAIGDLNGDFEPDVVTANRSANAVSILFNVPDQVLAAPRPPTGGGGFDLVAPNPARDASRIEYTIAHPGKVRLEVSDITGRVVATLFEGIQPAGRYHSSWDGLAEGKKQQAGIYFIRLRTPGQAFARKLIRIQ